MTFEELKLTKPLLNALKDLDYIHPTPIQQKAFSLIHSGKDVLGIAQTGTGKTFAYLLPILANLKYSTERHPRILIVVPTRELVLQIIGEIDKLTKYVNLRYEGIYGGTNINTQKQKIYDGLDILVSTPGRLIDIAGTGILRLKGIKTLVIDEVDKLLDLGFRTELTNFLESLPLKRQNLMFSATVSDDIEKIINRFFYEPIKVEIAAHGTPLEKVIQKGFHVPNFNTKINLLENLLATDKALSKVLVFVSNKSLADRLHEGMEKTNPGQSTVIHSYKSHANRVNALEGFKNETFRVLIATDIAARGLDISDVTHVINFDTPKVPEDYIHRIGRTGRANKDGIAITFINEVEEEYIANIELLMNKELTVEKIPEEVKISFVFSEEEKVSSPLKNKIKNPSIKKSQGNFHEKKDKNKKVNLGGPSRKQASKPKTARYYKKNN